MGQLAGGVILGVALWLRHDTQTSNLLILQFEGHQAPGTFYISEYTAAESQSTFWIWSPETLAKAKHLQHFVFKMDLTLEGALFEIL